jgi:hypothetical protein
MTELITELAEQAGFENGHQDRYGNSLSYELEKFAELIVRECVIHAEREWIRNGSDTEHNQAVSKVIESIKQHFGVEE